MVCNKSDYVKLGLDHSVDLFQESVSRKIATFTNSKKKTFAFIRSFENKVDKTKLAALVNILHIHGSLLNTRKNRSFILVLSLSRHHRSWH